MSKSVPMPYTRRVRSGGVTKKVLVFPSDPSYRASRPPRKKKAMRKPAPFRTKTGALVAYCTEVYGVRAGRHCVILATTMIGFGDPERIRGFARWLLRAAAWVEGGRR